MKNFRRRGSTAAILAAGISVSLISPAAASTSGTTPADRIAQALAQGDGPAGARLICAAGAAADPVTLGRALSTADDLVRRQGPDDQRVQGFAAAVDVAYQTAGVSAVTAGGSFAIGLADVTADYVAAPGDPVGWSTSQAAIGSAILLRVIPSWLTTGVAPRPSCAGG